MCLERLNSQEIDTWPGLVLQTTRRKTTKDIGVVAPLPAKSPFDEGSLLSIAVYIGKRMAMIAHACDRYYKNGR